jgi:hypothetical protein
VGRVDAAHHYPNSYVATIGATQIMTNADFPDRLDRIENAIQSLVAVAQNHESRLADAQALAQRNTETIAELIQLQRQMFERSESEMTSIRAALERIDRVMDYLMRRDGGQA